MTTVLVVDDSAVERRRIGAFLESGQADKGGVAGMKVVYAGNGREALAVMREALPDAVLTDLRMPEMDGLELVAEVRGRYPSVPVVLMTAHGSFDVAVKALERGAASYVPKVNLAHDLLRTVEGILVLTQAARGRQAALKCLTRTEYCFALANDPALIPPVVGWLEDGLEWAQVCDETGRLQVGVAVREALVYAMEQGNLEVPSKLKQTEEAAYHRLVEDRRTCPPYRDRRVYITALGTPAEVTYVVRDEGPGVPLPDRPDPADPATLGGTYGRGLVLIRAFMDEVRYSPVGNEVAMVKRRGP
ncbi:MAG: hypothetical protein JWO38_3428 [Gemmataceae bacterium]|nr:hypothetical protein [Gemmataceae bacterium]